MDYEKKYKEALSKAKSFELPEYKNIMASIFPELAESEDERIRKELITYCRNTRCVTEEGAERIAKWIAWLEKQGSSSVKWQKNTPDNKPAINHTVLMKTTIGIVEGEWRGEHWFQYRWSCRLKDSEVLYWMNLYELDKQDEQKPTSDTKYEVKADGSLSVNGKPFDYEHATITQKDFAPEQELKKIEDEIEIPFGAKDSELQEETYYIPKGFHAEIDDDKVVIKKGEKSADWSDEDEKMCKIALSCIETLEDISNGKNMHADVKDWLKSLKDRVQPKNEEWSEEDELNLQGITDEIQANKSSAPSYDIKTYDRFLNWLKSLKDRIIV